MNGMAKNSSLCGPKALEAFGFAAMLLLIAGALQSQAQTPPPKATYHIDISEQYHIFEQLEAAVTPYEGKPFPGTQTTLKFDCPLGFVGAKSEENRSYRDQCVHSIEVYVDGKKAPYIDQPTVNDRFFWCLDKTFDTLSIDQVYDRGGDQVAVRFPTAAGSTTPIDVKVIFDVTTITRRPVEGGQGGAEPPLELSDKLKEAYSSFRILGPTIDPDRLRRFFAQPGVNLSSSSDEPARAIIGKFINYFARNVKYQSGKDSDDVSSVYENPGKGWNCNPLALSFSMGVRACGGIARKIGGRNSGGDADHAVVQIYDPEAKTFVSIDSSSATDAKNANISKRQTSAAFHCFFHFIIMMASQFGGAWNEERIES